MPIPVLHIRHPVTDRALCGAPPVYTKPEAMALGLTAAQMRIRDAEFIACGGCVGLREHIVRGTFRVPKDLAKRQGSYEHTQPRA